MDGSFNYIENLGRKLEADVKARRGEEQPASEDIGNALQIIGDPRITTVEPYDMLRVVELLNSALEKMRRAPCMICEQRVPKEQMHDDGVCFECRDPRVEPGMQMGVTDGGRLPFLHKGILRSLRGYGDSTAAQIRNRVNPVHDKATEQDINDALEELLFAKCVAKVGYRFYRLTEAGRNELRK